MLQQDQFLEVIDRDEAQRRFYAQLDLKPLGVERVPLERALGRVLAEDVAAPVDVPTFDRANVDGFAVRAADTYGASQEEPRKLRQNPEAVAPGMQPHLEVAPGMATAIATGAMIPRGADAVVMVEHTDTVVPQSGRREQDSTGMQQGGTAMEAGTGMQGGTGVSPVLPGRRGGTGSLSASAQGTRADTPPIAPASVERGAEARVDKPPVPPRQGDEVEIYRPVAPGANVTYAGTDIARREIVLRRGTVLTARETGVLAAIGVAEVPVYCRPRVAILSTGNELVAPGQTMRPGLVYDSNATILADSLRELGGEPVLFGIFPDEEARLREAVEGAIRECDLVLLSGGTSKGAGDLNYRVVSQLKPGIVVHGVALKPGKPLCLAVSESAGSGQRSAISGQPSALSSQQAAGSTQYPVRSTQYRAPAESGPRRVPVVILPGFPTSAIFTFHEFVAPVLRAFAGRMAESENTVSAVLPLRINSERGRTEYVLVSLVERMAEGVEGPGQASSGTHAEGAATAPRWVAYPMGKGSGSVTAFSRADGFIAIPRQREYLEEGEGVEVRLLGRELRPADLVVIGSHCVGVDYLLGRLQEGGYTSKFLAVGSEGGLAAAKRGECDLAGVHLLDPETDTYNTPFLTEQVALVAGYTRLQGIVFRPGDVRFEGRSVEEAVAAALADRACRMVNRNRGSGTRVLIERLLGGARPPGYSVEPRSHNAVAAAVVQGRADWGVAIETVARQYGLAFLPLREECYDFVVPKARLDRPAMEKFRELLADEATRAGLRAMGFQPRRA